MRIKGLPGTDLALDGLRSARPRTGLKRFNLNFGWRCCRTLLARQAFGATEIGADSAVHPEPRKVFRKPKTRTKTTKNIFALLFRLFRFHTFSRFSTFLLFSFLLSIFDRHFLSVSLSQAVHTATRPGVNGSPESFAFIS